MTAPRIALVTARAARGTDHDMAPLRTALQAAGAHAAESDWDDPGVAWSRFDLALLRSTWDYSARRAEFLAWAGRVAAQTVLLNPLDIVRWNTDKHYLADLARAGVPIVPGRFIEPGEDARHAVDRFLRHGFADASAAVAGNGDIVVKPAVGAGSRDAQRHARANRGAIAAHVERLLGGDRSVLVQPYLPRVDTAGETALVFFDGVFSHALRKGPLLQRDAAPTAALYAEESIAPRVAAADELAVARQALAAIPGNQPLLYARVDLLRDDAGAPRLLELELVEPSVFVGCADGAAARFAQAILARVMR